MDATISFHLIVYSLLQLKETAIKGIAKLSDLTNLVLETFHF